LCVVHCVLWARHFVCLFNQGRPAAIKCTNIAQDYELFGHGK